MAGWNPSHNTSGHGQSGIDSSKHSSKLRRGKFDPKSMKQHCPSLPLEVRVARQVWQICFAFQCVRICQRRWCHSQSPLYSATANLRDSCGFRFFCSLDFGICRHGSCGCDCGRRPAKAACKDQQVRCRIGLSVTYS